MTLEKAQRAIHKAKNQTAKARETLIKALILETGGNPRKVRLIEVTGFVSLLRSVQK
jgi:acyl-CoA reductase-like NAD-dependent aldehyde dehydrogenase